MTSHHASVSKAISLAHTGSFLELADNQELLGRLKRTVGGEYPEWEALSSRAILAEVYDQLGSYDDAAKWAPPQFAEQHMELLESETKSAPNLSKAKLQLIRSRAMAILQCAVSAFRRGDHDTAIQWITRCLIVFDSVDADKLNPLPGFHNHRVQALLLFWRGRVHTALYSKEGYKKAHDDFRRALEQTDRSLDVEIRSATATKKNEVIALGNYLLATCLGFGLGQLLQLESRLTESLDYLRLAVPLFRGTVDSYRRGYAHLLMGIALRSRHGKKEHAEDLERAIKFLREAITLFGGDGEPPAPGGSLSVRGRPAPRSHALHLARACHHLALALYQKHLLFQDGSLREARIRNDAAREHVTDDSRRVFADRILVYGVLVGRSLIECSAGDYVKALEFADRALKQHDRIPSSAHAWAWLAKGQAAVKALAFANGRDNERREIAEVALDEVIRDPAARCTDLAAAHLHFARMYVELGEHPTASTHYQRAVDLLHGVEHGWVLHLAEETEQMLTRRSGRCVIDVERLLKVASERRTKKERYASVFAEIEVEVWRGLLSLLDSDSRLQNDDEKAELIGVSRRKLSTKREKTGMVRRRTLKSANLGLRQDSM